MTLDGAARAVLAALQAGGEPPAAEWATLRKGVKDLRAPFGVFADADDALHQTLVRILELQPEIDNPWGYIAKSVRHAAIGAARKGHAADDDAALARLAADDEIARLLDARSAANDVEAALARHVELGDDVCVRVIAAWLTLAEANGKAPTTREVATRVPWSHTRVQQALRQFRNTLAGGI